MRADKILGIELNEKFCQISYYEPEKHEPETLEVSVDNFQIPMILGKWKGCCTACIGGRKMHGI